MTAILELDALDVRYGTVPAVRGLSLEVGKAELVGLIGPNGAGKSTTLHAIMGVVPPSGGDVRLAGRSMRGRAPESIARAGIALVPEGRRIFGELTVEENLRLGLSARRGNGAEPLAVAYDLFPMLADFRARQAGALSGGQQQQLAIGRALVAGPDVLLLDEPSLGLAPTMVDTVFAALTEIRERGVTILLVEQRAQRTVALADRTYVLANGELRMTLTPGRRGRHREDDPGVPRMTLAVVDAQTLVDAVGLGAVYALMAVGIGLVFGMLRLVNFAYGQLIMAGAYTLAFTSGWPVAGSVLACFAVVIALSFLMDGVVFRPLRTQSPAVMLVTTFAIAFLLQAVALILDIRDGTIGEPATSVASLNQVVTIGGVDVRKVTILAVIVAITALGLLALLLGRTTIGLQMRAASTDFRTARLLGVKADRVIGAAILLSAILAATVAVILTVQFPLVSPDFALKETIVVLVGVVVGGIDRLWTATLGGFAIGFATGVINGALPTDKTVFLPSAVFALVILVLLLRPAGLFARGRATAVDRV